MKTCTSELLFVVVLTASLSGTMWAKTDKAGFVVGCKHGRAVTTCQTSKG